MAFPVRDALPLVSLCSRPAFAARDSLRVVDFDDTNAFIGLNDITRQKIQECPVLADIKSIDPIPYLAEFMGMPGLVKRASGFCEGQMVFSENLKYFTRVCSSRVAGNKIKFNYGSEEFKEERDNCWEFCVKRVRISIIKKHTRLDCEIFPLELKREEDSCPVCYDKLTGQNVCCAANHQTCLTCYNLLALSGGVKKCVLCNKPNYTADELAKVLKMNGTIIEKDPYFYLSLKSSANSFKDYTYNEALFFGMLKALCRSYDYNYLEQMLISGLYNFYMTHNERFSDYNFNILNQTDVNNRTYDPFHDDINPVIEKFLDVVNTPKIFNDVAHTILYLPVYEDIKFYEELENIDGNISRLKEYPNDKKIILQREIFFRSKINQLSRYDLKETMTKIFQKIAKNSFRYERVFSIVKVELEQSQSMV